MNPVSRERAAAQASSVHADRTREPAGMPQRRHGPGNEAAFRRAETAVSRTGMPCAGLELSSAFRQQLADSSGSLKTAPLLRGGPGHAQRRKRVLRRVGSTSSTWLTGPRSKEEGSADLSLSLRNSGNGSRWPLCATRVLTGLFAELSLLISEWVLVPASLVGSEWQGPADHWPPQWVIERRALQDKALSLMAMGEEGVLEAASARRVGPEKPVCFPCSLRKPYPQSWRRE